RRRALTGQAETHRAKRKELSRIIGQARARHEDSSETEKLATAINDEIAQLERQSGEAETRLNDLLAQLPNIPDDRVPAGGKENNQVVRVWGEKPPPLLNAADHVAIC